MGGYSGLRLLTTVLLLLSLSAAAAGIQQRELDSLLAALHSRGYSRFSNAIATSDLLYDVVSFHSSTFTFFAPPDSSLYTLDMEDSCSDYTSALRCHVIPRRLTANQLRRSLNRSTFDSLVKGALIRVEMHRRSVVGDEVITVNGVLVSLPGLFYSRNVAVHGLAGIFNFTHHSPVVRRRHPPPQSQSQSPNRPIPLNRLHAPPPPPVNSSSNHSQFHSPPPPENFSSNRSNIDVSQLMNQTNLANLSDFFQNETIESTVSDPGFSQHSLPMMAPAPENAGMKVSGIRKDGDDVDGVSPENFAGVMEMFEADFEKWDQRIFDCLLTDEFGHVSTPPGYLYTRQQPHPTCAALHQFLHLQQF